MGNFYDKKYIILALLIPLPDCYSDLRNIKFQKYIYYLVLGKTIFSLMTVYY